MGINYRCSKDNYEDFSISCGVFVLRDKAWRPAWSSSFKRLYMARCLCMRFLPWNSSDTIVTLISDRQSMPGCWVLYLPLKLYYSPKMRLSISVAFHSLMMRMEVGLVYNVQDSRLKSFLELQEKASASSMIISIGSFQQCLQLTFVSICCWTGPCFAVSMNDLKNTEEGSFSDADEYWRWERPTVCLDRRLKCRSMSYDLESNFNLPNFWVNHL